MITVSVKGLLIGILLIALIVLVIFLTVLIANVTETIKKANSIIDGGTAAADIAIAKVGELGESAKYNAARASNVADIGLQLAQGIVNRVVNK